MKVRKKLKNPLHVSPTPVSQYPQPLRQRVDLKGPRVKHVCRSASVALGQPIATFGGDEKKVVPSDKCATKGAKALDKSTDKKDVAVKDNKEQKTNSQIIASNCNQQQSYPKRSKVNQNIINSSLPVVSFYLIE